MELTPQQLCDVEFSEQWRGYNRDQVDDFIERVAAAVSTLQDRLRKMTERAVRAEQRSLEGSEADGAARRTLVLAQRTADATVAEAKETAARLIAQAQEEARAIILAAEAANESMPAAEPTARAEIADLEVTRSRLQADVAALESHVTDRRSRIKDLLGELQRHVDEGLDWRIAQWPSGRLLTDDLDDDDIDAASDIDTAGDIDTASAIDTASVAADTTSAESEPDPYEDDPAEDFDHTGDISVDLAPVPPEWEPDDEAPPDLAEADEVEVGSAVDVGGAVEVGNAVEVGRARDDAGQGGEAHERQDELAVPAPLPGYDDISARDVDDDTFFAQLRGALDDDAPLGPREDASGLLRWRDEAATAVAEAPSLYDQGDPDKRKFGRKKRRQR